jgi:hypothetical protein
MTVDGVMPKSQLSLRTTHIYIYTHTYACMHAYTTRYFLTEITICILRELFG